MDERRNKESISRAVQILEEKGMEILTVSEWADALGYSRAYFSRAFTSEFGLNPKDYLRDLRLQAITEEIHKDPDAIGYKIAVNLGFTDERALHKYLVFHCNKTLRQYKKEVL